MKSVQLSVSMGVCNPATGKKCMFGGANKCHCMKNT